MKRQLFEAVADTTQQLLFAANAAQALGWCLENNPAFAEAENIMVKRRSDVVDLNEGAKGAHVEPATHRSAPAKRTPPPMPKKRAAAKESGKAGGVPEGMILVTDLAKEAGITTEGMRHRLNAAGVKVMRIEGWGRPSAVDANDARAKLLKRGAACKAKKPKPAPAPKPTKPKPAPQPTSPQQDRFLRIEAVAKSMGLDEGDLEIIKRRGNIKGGFGWINIAELEAYMASEEYVPVGQ